MFAFRNGSMHAEPNLPETVARKFGTPCCVHSRANLAASPFAQAIAGGDVGRGLRHVHQLQ